MCIFKNDRTGISHSCYLATWDTCIMPGYPGTWVPRYLGPGPRAPVQIQLPARAHLKGSKSNTWVTTPHPRNIDEVLSSWIWLC